MSVHDLVLLMLTLAVLVTASVLAGVIGFGVARWAGLPVPDAVVRGAIACASTLTISIAVLGVFVTAIR
ncbi:MULTISPECIES: hypothetical protein [Streptomyces]|uniref:hypothetical protein n=1 Tax=Streptomyces TaxID=1883 RepID=UPI002251000E|nr:hypothetical protein [Streptomyces viridodiastaticus]MCX4625138.1 hypothetical protein [Streptomyces viridodiastaticus]